MIEKLEYYVDLFLTLCGYDKATTIISFGDMFIVFLALLVVIWAFYQAIVLTVWPGEQEESHIKRSVILEAEDIK